MIMSICPNLVGCEWSILGGPTQAYNCLANSVGERTKWIGYIGPPEWGDEFVDDYGNDNGIIEDSDFDAFYVAKGYERTMNVEEAVIVLYGDPMRHYHAARKRDCGCGEGRWIVMDAKLGKEERIEHVFGEESGGTYGNPCRYYKEE